MPILDRLFTAAGYLAALFLALIAVVILAQITGRLAGFVVPSGDDFAAWCLAATSFLALAHTLRRGEHIRVTLILSRLAPAARRAAELWSYAFATAGSFFFAWSAVTFTLESFEFGEMSSGTVSVPLWLPQSAMALGLVLIALAFAEELVRLLRGGEVRAEAEAARTE